MWENANELLYRARREIIKAREEGRQNIEIVLVEWYNGELKKTKAYCEKFQIKKISDQLRLEFSDCDIQSRVGPGPLKALITYEKGPCQLSYPLLWKLQLRLKEA